MKALHMENSKFELFLRYSVAFMIMNKERVKLLSKKL